MDSTIPTPRLIAAAARNLAEVFVGSAIRAGKRTAILDAARSSDLQLDLPLANTTILLEPLAAERIPGLMEHLNGFYGQVRGGGWSLWNSWPSPDFTAFGFELLGRPPLMVRMPGGPAAPVPPELRFAEAYDTASLGLFEKTFIAGYPIPELASAAPGALVHPDSLGGLVRYWIGYVADEPITVACVCPSDGVVGIHFVATLEHARGKGYGTAITDLVANLYPSLPAVLQSSTQGRSVYERIGFREIARYALWMKQRATFVS